MLPNIKRSYRYMPVFSFCDESGKFNDHAVTSFAAVSGTELGTDEFNREWKRKLRTTGLTCLTMKAALRHDLPLSQTNPALGITNRVDALLPFVECIRKHMEVIAAVSVHSEAFAKAPSHIREILGKSPHQFAFSVTMMEILSYVSDEDTLNIVCDDEEQMAWEMYCLYRILKKNYPDARHRLSGIGFADDEVFPLLQAADMISSLSRREAGLHFFKETYDFKPLYDELCKPLSSDKLWAVNPAFAGSEEFTTAANDIIELKKQYPGQTIQLADFGKSFKIRRK